MKAIHVASVVLCFFLSHGALATEAPPTARAKAEAASNSKINLNHAAANDLAGSFKQIGQKRAEAIVSYRQSHGPFNSVAELAHVRGLSQAFVETNLAQLQTVYTVK